VSPRNETKVKPDPRTDMQIPKLLLTLHEASWSSGISQVNLRQLISRGKIPIVMNGNRPLIRVESLQKFAEENEIYRNRKPKSEQEEENNDSEVGVKSDLGKSWANRQNRAKKEELREV